MTSEQIKSAMAEMERRQEVLDITNAEHIVLWLEANIKDSPIAWLACRIIEAHEAIVTAREASAHQKGFESGFNQGHKFGRSLGKEEGRRKGIEEAAKATVIEADRSSPLGDKRFILQNIATAIRAIDPATVGEGK